MTWRHFHGGVLWENLPTTTCWFIEASTVLVREIATTQGVQIFGSVASSRSRLHVAMRNPRQTRRTATICTSRSQTRRNTWREAEIRTWRFGAPDRGTGGKRGRHVRLGQGLLPGL
jgi:hypothetical protein